MTATDFRDLLDPWVLFVAGGGRSGLRGTNPDQLLARSVPWVDCPTCQGKGRVVAFGEEYTGEVVACGTTQCPTCTGTGKATVAQLLAWGQAVAQTDPEDWIEFGDQRSAVTGYRSRILGVQP